MATLLRFASFRRNLAVIMLIAVGSAVASASVACLVTALLVSRDETRTTLTGVAQLVGSSTAAAVRANDRKGGARSLAGALAPLPQVTSARIVLKEGTTFATYERPSGESLPARTGLFRWLTIRSRGAMAAAERILRLRLSDLEVAVPLTVNGRPAGTVVITATAGAGAGRLFLVTCLAGGGAVLAGFLLAGRLQRRVTEPLVQLIEVMRQVSAGTAPMRRAVRTSADDLGTLVTGVNQLLDERERRDGQLLAGQLELEQRIGERTRELQDARDAAETACQAKADFLATMSHEIRTPLNGVLGMAELILKSGLTPQQRQMAETIRRSGESLLSIINGILDLSKLDAGRVELEQRPFDLYDLVEEAVALFTGSAERKKIELASLIPRTVPTLLVGDPERVRQVLVNLLNNAIKFTEQANVIVTVYPEEVSADTALLRFEVSDSGIGIAFEAQAAVFERYSQADSSISRRFGGTGLGLTIARQLVELMGGEMGVSSLPEVGTNFWFTVRLGKQAEDPAGTNAPPQPLANRRALIISANSRYRWLLQQQLSGWGMSCETVAAGAEAAHRLRTGDPASPCDVVILDPLPDDDDAAVLRALREDPSLGSVRLLLLVPAGGSAADAELATWRGCTLTKPLRAGALRCALVALFEAPAGTAPLPAPVAITPAAPPLSASVLLVEDNSVNREIAQAQLAALGCTVVTAVDGAGALAAWSSHHFDLVLMDCELPDMNGREATRQIREREESAWGELQKSIIIAVSAHIVQEERERCLAAGMDDYLQKPFSEAELRLTLERWLTAGADTAAITRQPRFTGDAPPAGGARDSCRGTLQPEYLDAIRALQQPGSPDLVAKVLTGYLASAPALIAAIRTAVAAADPTGVSRAAHSLKSGSANLGALHLAELCSRMESQGRAGSLDGAAGLLEEIEAAYAAVQSELRILNQGAGP